MAKFEVYFTKDSQEWSNAQFEKVEPQEVIELSRYKKVAVVEADNLETVFESTNNIHDAWVNNENVEAEPNPERNNEYRSMCVGDLVLVPGTNLGWRCQSFGWVEIRV